jgi:hypothetical protein
VEEKPIMKYFTGNDADQFTFYRIPKLLLENEMSNENQQEKFNAGKETMFNEIRVLGEMSDITEIKKLKNI